MISVASGNLLENVSLMTTSTITLDERPFDVIQHALSMEAMPVQL